MANLLLELFSEEIPAKMQQKAGEALLQALCKEISLLDLKYERAQYFVTPRRLACIVEGLPLEIKASKEVVRGPRIGSPQKAVEGFLRKTGLKKEQLSTEKSDKGEFYVAVTKQKARKVSEILVPVIESVLHAFVWPKSMRWGSHNIKWIRPLHRIICLLDEEILPVSFGHIKASNKTEGHRFLAPKTITMKHPDEYKQKLYKAKVIVDTSERKKAILTQIDELVSSKGLSLEEDVALMDEVVGLVEWPIVHMGKIEPRFMQLPKEALVTSMRVNQKYFSLLDKDRKLAAYFILVANIVTEDEGKAIIAGNERVLKARLADADFFYKQDIVRGLDTMAVGLSTIVMHRKLGTVADKIERVKQLAKYIAVWVPHANLVKVERAAQLCKADLLSDMVTEFPELQGKMGAYYALAQEEDQEIADAIRDHYLPQGPDDSCPIGAVSIPLALADKIDTLVGLFLIDEKPSGSKDPFALRRAAIGVIRILLENQLHIPLKLLFEKSVAIYPQKLLKLDKSVKLKQKKADINRSLLTFFSDRLKAYLKSKHIRYDLINSVFDDGVEDDLLHLVERVSVLDEFLTSEDGENLLSAYRRATSIVAIEEKNDKATYDGQPNQELLVQDEESVLFNAFEHLKPQIEQGIKEYNYRLVMEHLAKLRGPVDVFFDKVTVNCEDVKIRENRLLILAQIRNVMDRVANFSRVEG